MTAFRSPLAKLRVAMDNMDGEEFRRILDLMLKISRDVVQAICNYTVPPEEEDYGIPKELDTSPTATAPSTPAQPQSHLRLLPPPLFSRQIVPHIYKYVDFCRPIHNLY